MIGILMVLRRCIISSMLVTMKGGVQWNGVLKLEISILLSI